jgi:hypothetical protein
VEALIGKKEAPEATATLAGEIIRGHPGSDPRGGEGDHRPRRGDGIRRLTGAWPGDE